MKRTTIMLDLASLNRRRRSSSSSLSISESSTQRVCEGRRRTANLVGWTLVIRRRVIERSKMTLRLQREKSGRQGRSSVNSNSRRNSFFFLPFCLQTHRCCNETAVFTVPIDEISNQWNRSTRSNVYIISYGFVAPCRKQSLLG